MLNLKELIKNLQELEKKGITVVKFKGTILSEDDGNKIIATTEKQF